MRPEVRRTQEFERVSALPRRTLRQADADAWADVLTPELRCAGATAALRPWQAMSIAEAAENRGAWLALPVGLGKTLISFLLPRVLTSPRTIIIGPAGLREKTAADFASYTGVWRAPNPPPRYVSPTELEQNQRLLFEIRPTLIIIDEADELANRNSAACRQIDRYIVDAQDAVSVVCMTGTPSRNSIMGYWHLLCWCLRDRAPVPLNEGEALMWAGALDEKVNWSTRRVHPGPLGNNITTARAWFSARLEQTPGVVLVDGDSCEQPLTVRIRLAKEDAVLDAEYQRFLEKQENPDGIPVSDPLSRWRIDGLLGTGVFQYYDPPPPQGWRDCRRAVAAFVRDEIDASTHTARPLDTEGQVLRRYADHELVIAWREWCECFTPTTKARWLTTSAVESAVAWLRESAEPGVVWCGGVEFGEALAVAARLQYFGPKGKDVNGARLHSVRGDRSIVASWNANKKGYNLQMFRRLLIVHPPQSAKWLEQIIGRHHRSLQTRPVVCDILATSGGTLDAFEAAFNEARFAKATVRLTQKILRARIERPRVRVTASNAFRWAQRGET